MDYSFGLTSTILPSVLGHLNAEVISLHNFVDATRFHPDPQTQAQDSDDTGRIMRSLGYELGFRMEAGAEKISLIDDRGVWYNPMRLLSILVKLFCESHKEREPYKIAVSIVAPSDIEEIAKDYNVEVIRIKNSHSAMMDITTDENVLFVGGIYGGYIFREFLFASDGMFTVGQILEMIAKTGYSISELDEQLPQRFLHSLEVSVPWDSKGTVMRKAMDHSENMKRQLIEGVKVFVDDESVLMLPSKEHPIFYVYGESSDFEKAVNITQKYANLISQWKDDK